MIMGARMGTILLLERRGAGPYYQCWYTVLLALPSVKIRELQTKLS